jgi:hypothetical protein
MVDAAFDGFLERESLVGTSDNDDNFSRLQLVSITFTQSSSRSTYIHHRLNANRQRHLWHLVQIIAKEPRIRQNSLIRQRLDSRSAAQTRSRLVERNMSIRADSTQEKLNTARTLDLLLVRYALFFEVWCVAVEDVDVGWIDVDVAEEVLVHEGVVGFGMFARDADVFVLHPI